MDRSSAARAIGHRIRILTITITLMAAAASFGAVPVAAQDDGSDALGTQLVNEFIDILKQPDEAKRDGLAVFLADEFQIVRSNGVRMDQAGYIENPAIIFEVEISDVHATEGEDVVVVSYLLSVDEILDGVTTKTTAPRLSVFTKDEDGEWQISAHANFGALDPS